MAVFPTTSQLDRFRRPDAADLGANYTIVSGYDGLPVRAYRCAVNDGGSGFEMWDRKRYKANQQVWIVVAEEIADMNAIWLAFRCNAPQATDGYLCLFSASAGTLTATLSRISTSVAIGTSIDLGVAAFSPGDLVGIDAVGGRYTLYYWPVGGVVTMMGYWEDANILTPGYIGLGASAFPDTLYVATSAGGIYYTETFTPPDDVTQPVWTAVNGGLGVLTIKNLDIDPFDKVGRQVCLTSTEENCYIRYGAGNWQSLITQAQVRTATQATAKVWWVSFDRGVPGRVWVYALVLSSGVSDMAYFGYSDNDGASWTWQSNADSPTIREGGNFIANGSLIYRGVNDGPGGRSVIQYSGNTGATWLRSAQLGISVWNCNVWLSPFGLVYSAGNGVGGPDLVQFDAGLLITVLQDALNLGGNWQVNDPQTMWHSSVSSGYQRIIDTTNASLYTTLDGWITVVDAAPAPLVAGWNFSSLVAPLASNEDWMILGPRLLAVGQEHIIYTLDGDTSIPVGKAGVDPVGGVNSIPLAASGLAMNGIGIVG